MKRISWLRRGVQFLFLVLVVYGGAMVFHGQKVSLPGFFPVAATPAEFKQMTATTTAPPQKQTFNLYMPFKSCRYARGLGVFRACFVHFLQESVSWQDPLRIWLPYLALFVGLSVLLGRFTCGWICPLGFLQEVLGGVRRGLKVPEVKLTEQQRTRLRNWGLATLVAILALSWVGTLHALSWAVRDGLYLAGCQTCPGRLVYSALTGYPIFTDLRSPIFLGWFLVSVLFLVFFLSAFFVNRIWCSFCPNGILIGWFNRGRLLTQEKDPLTCARCGVCANVCILGSRAVYQHKQGRHVEHADCVSCYRCVELCPQRSLRVTFLGLKLF